MQVGQPSLYADSLCHVISKLEVPKQQHCRLLQVLARFIPKYCIIHLTHFYTYSSIVEEDIHGEEISYEGLRGKYVYMINVASEDGNSKSSYQILKQLSQLRSDRFEIVIFPCNQFGDKEPRSERDIAYFARKHGYKGLIMSKGDVNGIHARQTFQWLKKYSMKTHIDG